ncbi:MAG: hypothetical protein AABZ17_07915, partial [Nitrospirota bacterium]
MESAASNVIKRLSTPYRLLEAPRQWDGSPVKRFLSCAFCEQEGLLATPFHELSLFTLFSGSGPRLSSTARVQRGPSEAARCAS